MLTVEPIHAGTGSFLRFESPLPVNAGIQVRYDPISTLLPKNTTRSGKKNMEDLAKVTAGLVSQRVLQ